jgi:hypothetical protein
MDGDCSFAYASDIADERGHKPGRIVELPFWSSELLEAL